MRLRKREEELEGVMMIKEYCTWKQDYEGASLYESACGNVFEFNHEGVEENGFLYCPYCGKIIDHFTYDAEGKNND